MLSPYGPRHAMSSRAVAVRRARKVLLGGLAFALMAMTLVVGMPLGADAYTPATIAAGVATKPTHTVTVTQYKRGTTTRPVKGETFDYKAVFVSTGMGEGGTASTTVITVNADLSAPWSSIPTTANFVISSPPAPGLTPSLSNCSTTTCTATYTNLPNSTVTFTAFPSVPNTLGAGVPIIGTAQIKTTVTPTMTLTPVSEEAPTACSGVYTFKMQVGGAGGWLMDFHFADAAGQGKVRLTNPGVPLTLWDGVSAATDTYRFLTPPLPGVAYTPIATPTGAPAPAAPVYRSPDTSRPYFPGDVIQTNYPNARWLDSMNWRWDPSTYTGDTWLPGGTIIEIRRHVTYENCAPGGFSTDFTTARPFGVSVEMSRPITSAQQFGYDEFATPGVSVPLTCEKTLLVSATSGGQSSTNVTLSQWDPVAKTTTLISPSALESHAIAATDKYPDYLFHVSYSDRKLYYRNLSNPGTASIELSRATGLPTGWADPNGAVVALAFDPSGNLWVVGGFTRLYYLTAADITNLLGSGSGSVSWHQGPNLAGGLNSVGDIAFDGAGNLWVIEDQGSSVNPVKIAKYSTAGMIGTTTSITPTSIDSTNIVAPSGNKVRGLAFVNGVLYAGRYQTSSTNSLYIINQGTGAGTPVTGTGYTAYGASDFASCNFPTGTTPSQDPTYKWQKSVVNPDGSVATAGGTGQLHTINPDGTITVKYLITVRNTGATAGTHPNIVDNVRVPNGFTITGITTSATTTTPGVAPSWSGNTGSFTIAGQSLDPSTADGTSVTYLVTVNAKANLATMTAAQWTEAATCNTDLGGTPTAGGFFNTAVHQTSDADGANNNDACVSVAQEKAKLNLVKKIVDANGAPIAALAGDAQYFTLAAGAKPSGVGGFSGSSPTSGTSFGQYVLPGSYILSEAPNNAAANAYVFGSTWSCVRTGTSTQFPQSSGEITLANNDDVTCTITNSPRPKAHIVKTATTVSPGNAHIGQTVTAAADGTFLAKYTITVTNPGPYATSPGPITDYFTPPAGVVWDGTKSASLTYLPGSTGAVLSNPTNTDLVWTGGTPQTTTATQAQLASGATLAKSVGPIPFNGSVSFTIEIPLKLDQSASAADPTKTNFQVNAAKLASCTAATNVSPHYANDGSGIPNTVSLTGEDLSYSAIAVEDNVACISVLPPTAVVTVHKLASNCDVNLSTCPLVGAQFALFAVDPASAGAQPIANGLTVSPTDGSTFTSSALSVPGTYWVVETQAPTGFSLLATPIKFDLTSSGVAIVAGGSPAIAVTGNGNLTINVTDQTIGPLPEAGGSGHLPYAVFGLLLLLTAAYLHRGRGPRTPGRHTLSQPLGT